MTHLFSQCEFQMQILLNPTASSTSVFKLVFFFFFFHLLFAQTRVAKPAGYWSRWVSVFFLLRLKVKFNSLEEAKEKKILKKIFLWFIEPQLPSITKSNLHINKQKTHKEHKNMFSLVKANRYRYTENHKAFQNKRKMQMFLFKWAPVDRPPVLQFVVAVANNEDQYRIIYEIMVIRFHGTVRKK